MWSLHAFRSLRGQKPIANPRDNKHAQHFLPVTIKRKFFVYSLDTWHSRNLIRTQGNHNARKKNRKKAGEQASSYIILYVIYMHWRVSELIALLLDSKEICIHSKMNKTEEKKILNNIVFDSYELTLNVK